MFKRLFLPLLALAVASVFLASCSKDEGLTDISSISFSNPPSILPAGQTQTLAVKVYPADTDAPYTLGFTSSDAQVATVDAQGKLTTLRDGQTVISVFVKERPQIKASFTLTVRSVEITGVEFIATVGELFVGQTFALRAQTVPSDATSPATLVFSSSDPRVAGIDAAGTITALKEGTAVITVAVEGKPNISASFSLTIRPVYKAPKNAKFQKVVYFPSYRTLTEAAIPDEKLRMADVACFAFASINSDYTLSVQEPNKLRALVARCHAAGVKIVISLNGSHSLYAAMTASADARARFIGSLRGIVDTYGLDGVDNDWEYPRTTDGSDKGNTALMRELSCWLHDPAVNKLLTMAITPGKYVGATSNAIQKECFDYVDWFNIMVYDDFSNDTPGINHSPFSLLETAYKYWVVTREMPKSKFVAGIPVYGRSSGLGKSVSMAYSTILAQGGDPDADQATVTSSSYNDGKTPFTVYYNGRKLVRKKTRYCIDQGLGGVMFWEAGQDTQDDRSLIRAAHEEIGSYSALP